ncbi:hypothetical protein [Marinobacter alexandrii]|uniref:hypothetical protein n=1 Tax=Marinobacter alexandrii TaxID=2570351 RepID=UPI001109B9F2|nr:hypothetical protein [Marinobacter alexandrii]
MQSRQAESLFLIVLVVTVSLLSAGSSLKTVAVSLALFATCLAVFFYPSILDYLKRRRRGDRDGGD